MRTIALAAVPLPLLLLDGEGRVRGSNLAAQEALLLSEGRMIGLGLADFFAPEEEVRHLLTRADPCAGGVSSHRICLRRNGAPVSLHLGYSGGWDEREGADEGMTAVFVPEAQRREVEEHARRHELAETVARIALEMAHEVKNPLAAVRGAAQWLMEQPLSPDGREAAGQVMRGVDRIRERIDAFLQDGPRAAVAMERVNVHALIDEVTGPVAGIEVRRVFDPSLPDVLVHRARLQQALENLWRNAVEAADGWIEWQTRMAVGVRLPDHAGQVIEVRITNDGADIPEAIRERLFEPYVTGKARGSGLGLALVERVMLEHGGRVALRAERGRTCFVLHLPVREIKGA
ncbi:MAG: ATP-binding protein [Mariprofundaceae bacterium]